LMFRHLLHPQEVVVGIDRSTAGFQPVIPLKQLPGSQGVQCQGTSKLYRRGNANFPQTLLEIVRRRGRPKAGYAPRAGHPLGPGSQIDLRAGMDKKGYGITRFIATYGIDHPMRSTTK
jgi:hypothetical protein